MLAILDPFSGISGDMTLGALIGVGLGIGLSQVVAKISPLPAAVAPWSIVLAVAIVPLALATLRRAWRGDFVRHARLARRTLPIWLYVSVTGVVIYVMLYELAPR